MCVIQLQNYITSFGEIYFDKWLDLSDTKRSKMYLKHYPINLTLDAYSYEEWFPKNQMI